MAASQFHVSKEVAERLVSGKLSRRLRQSAVRHILTGCVRCMDLVRECASPSSLDYSAVLRRLGLSFVVAEGRVQEERKYATQLWPELERQPPEVRVYMSKHLPEFRTWGIYEITLEKVKTLSRNDPLQAVDMAHLAIAIAENIDLELYTEERQADLLGAAYTALGNSKRIAGDLEGAASALNLAETWLNKGSGDPYERANLISIRASLTTDLGQLEDAAEMLFPAIRIAKRLQDERLEGRLLLQQSSTIGFVDPVLALGLAERGVIFTERESPLELTGRYLISYWTNEVGDPEGALSAIEPYRYLFAKFEDVYWTGRLLNLEAQISRMEGQLDKSEFFFRRLVEHFAEADFEFDLALASLDLAEVLAIQGKTAESIKILGELYPVLQHWKLNGDILRAWLTLKEALRLQSIQDTSFRELAMTLRRKWHRKEQA
ncbi:MAG TPA: hypothetical protein VGM86_06875 [Thermoanaerobaculia bacterium]